MALRARLCTIMLIMALLGLWLQETHAEKTASGKKYRMLMVEAQSKDPYDLARIAQMSYLKTHGYVEGDNLEVTHFDIENDLAAAESVLQEELPKKYDVISISGTIAATAVKNVALGDPSQKIVFSCVTDPVGVGLIDNFEDPPAYNATGVAYPVPVKSRLRFIRHILPSVKTIGLIYAAMPQSVSYRKWIEGLLQNDPEFKDLTVIFREVPLVTGEDGNKAMAENARQFVRELNDQVDIFVSPNDQMGVRQYFPEMVYATATKPLVGIGKKDVMSGWGATMSIYPSHVSMGEQAGRMIKEIFEGKHIREILPQWPKENGVAFDMDKALRFGIVVPVDMIEMAGENIVMKEKIR